MGTWIERLGWERLFPLTPALSPGERENRWQPVDKSGALESGMPFGNSAVDVSLRDKDLEFPTGITVNPG